MYNCHQRFCSGTGAGRDTLGLLSHPGSAGILDNGDCNGSAGIMLSVCM